MLILELMTSLMLWISIMIPINSYLLGINERSPYLYLQKISDQTIFDITKVGSESLMSRNDLCNDFTGQMGPGLKPSPKSYILSTQNISVKSTSTEAVSIVSDGQNLFVSLNSASTTDYDLIVYDHKNIIEPLDRIDSGPGLMGATFVGKNLFAINTSVNSALQRFKFDFVTKKINKVGDYKIPWSTSYNPIYASKITAIYPHLFIGLKKNSGEELLSVDLNKIDLGLGLAIDKKWELDSSIQGMWPMYDKYLHLLISTAKEPEINDFCINCDFEYTTVSSSTLATTTAFSGLTPLSTFDLFGSLGNVRSLIAEDGSIYVGRSAGNNELFKINILRDYTKKDNGGVNNTEADSTTSVNHIYDLINSIDINDGIYSMLLSGLNLILVEGKVNSKIQIRNTNDLSKIIQTIDTDSTVSDIECLGDKIFGVGSKYEMHGTTTISITPIIFEMKPIY